MLKNPNTEFWIKKANEQTKKDGIIQRKQIEFRKQINSCIDKINAKYKTQQNWVPINFSFNDGPIIIEVNNKLNIEIRVDINNKTKIRAYEVKKELKNMK